jgi:hypothetical protein
MVREAVMTDPELTQRQRQMLIEIYESFRKETAAAAAGDAIEEDGDSDLPPSEAELAWPEDVDPEALEAGADSPAISPVSSE